MQINKHPFSGILVRLNSNDKSQTKKSNQNELHVNIWDFSSESILDIGLKLHKSVLRDSKDVEESKSVISIHIPWNIDPKNLFDIASGLDRDKLLKAIFNRDVKLLPSISNACGPKVDFPDSPKKNFVLTCLNTTSFKISPCSLINQQESSCIDITLPSTLKDDIKSVNVDYFYLRIRMLQVPEKVFKSIFDQKDKNLISSSTKTSVFDFRVNSSRGIPDVILNPNPKRLYFPEFSQIHLFIVVHRDKDPVFQNQLFVACRSLEDENVWNDYIKLDDNRDSNHHLEEVCNYLGYQWSQKSDTKDSPVKELVALARFTQVFSSRWIMLRFVIIILAISAASSGIWSLFFKLLDTSPNITNNSIYNMVILIFGLLIFAGFVYWIPDNFWIKLKRLIRCVYRSVKQCSCRD